MLELWDLLVVSLAVVLAWHTRFHGYAVVTVLLFSQMLTLDWDCRLSVAQDGWHDKLTRMTDTDGGLGRRTQTTDSNGSRTADSDS
jgi:hypothetical protein